MSNPTDEELREAVAGIELIRSPGKHLNVAIAAMKALLPEPEPECPYHIGQILEFTNYEWAEDDVYIDRFCGIAPGYGCPYIAAEGRYKRARVPKDLLQWRAHTPGDPCPKEALGRPVHLRFIDGSLISTPSGDTRSWARVTGWALWESGDE